MINFIVSIRIIMTCTCEITLKCKLKFKILQLIQCIAETDNNDVCVRDVEIQMQIVVFRIGVISLSAKFIKMSEIVRNASALASQFGD